MNDNNQTMKIFTAPRPVVPIRGVHLDLKGTPPTPRRLLELLDLFAHARFNCVLAEWEDTFPWSRYPELRSPTAYTPETICRFLARARELGIEVIPLVQCFGHSENVLSKPRFRHLREARNDYSEFCPSNPRSAQLVTDLAKDVLSLSDGSIRRFHLGGDEAWRMGTCPRCKAAISRHGKDSLYLGHVGPVLDYLNGLGIRPILWDDMMRHWPASGVHALAQRADLMAWSYGGDPVDAKSSLQESHLARFRKAGAAVWGASAYKGGEGAFYDIPDLKERMNNNLGWAKLAREFGLTGVVATAWGRYNTFMSPCETIEASLDSLALTALIMWNGGIPREPGKAARALLKSFKGGREWRSFEKCRRAASNLANWQIWDLKWTLELLERAAHRNGEPGRMNPAFIEGARRNSRKALKRGRELGRAFIRAHRGLVPERWLKLYVESRVRPIERRVRVALGR